MSNLSSWSAIIEEQGKKYRETQLETNRKLREGKNEAIAKLPSHTNEYLVDLMLSFYGTAFDQGETLLRMEFFEACKKEVLSRMPVEQKLKPAYGINDEVPVNSKVYCVGPNSYNLPIDKPLTVYKSGRGFLFVDTTDFPDAYKGALNPACFRSA